MDSLPPILAHAIDTDTGEVEESGLLHLRRLFKLGYVACVLLTLLLFGIYAARHWEETRQSLKTRLAFNTHLLASATQGRLAQYGVLADSLAASLRRHPQLLSDQGALEQRLKEAQAALGGIAVIRVIDAQGQILGATLPLGSAFEFHNNPLLWTNLLQARKLGRAVTGPLVQVPAVGHWVLPQLHFYAATTQAPEFWIGIGIDRMALGAFWARLLPQELDAASLNRSEAFILIRQDGYVLARWPEVPASRFQAFYARPQTGILVRSLQANEGESEAAFEGVVHSINQNRLGYWTRMGPNSPDLAVAVSLPASELGASIGARWRPPRPPPC